MDMEPASPADIPLYQQLARHLREAIQAGTLRPGDRLPSVRSLSKQHKVSLTTALQTYRQLENDALVEARPKSGYFVREKGEKEADFPKSAATDDGPPALDEASSVGIHQAISEVMHLAKASCRIRLDIATGPPEVYPTRKLQQIIASITRKRPGILTDYPTGTGDHALKSQIARRALDAGCRINPDEIVITSGSTESLNLGLRAVTKPGDTVAVESPTYFGILQILESLGLRALEIPTDPVTGISLDALDFATGRPGMVQAVVLMPNFHNPLGSLMPDEHKARLVRMLGDRQIPLLEDDAYGDLYYGERRPFAAKAFDKDGGVILCNSATKTLAPGLRIGWVVPGRWQSRVAMLKFTSSIVTPELAQAAIAEFMQDGGYDHHMRKFRAGVKKQTMQMIEAVRRYFPSGTAIARPQGGYLLWIALPEGISSRRVFDLARQQSIGIAPGLMFSNSGRFDHHIRLNCGHPWSAEIEDSVKKLGEIVGMCGAS
jgi:DNA-binding transcriptional MocR family regulator